MHFNCDTAREHMDAHALGALDREEAHAIDAHLASCSACRALFEEAREAAAAIAMSVPLSSSGPALKARVLASASVLRQNRVQRSRVFWPAAAAAALTLAVGGYTWGALAQRHANDLSGEQATLHASATGQSAELATVQNQLVRISFQNQQLTSATQSQDDIEDIVAEPDLQRITMDGTLMAPGASGRYLWSTSSHSGALVATKLPTLSEGQEYQLWLVYDDRWAPAGTFAVDDSGRGRLVVRPDQGDEAAGDAPRWFCVTIEPTGGSLTHSGPMVLRSTIP